MLLAGMATRTFCAAASSIQATPIKREAAKISKHHAPKFFIPGFIAFSIVMPRSC
jgi:hypothetical protein